MYLVLFTSIIDSMKVVFLGFVWIYVVCFCTCVVFKYSLCIFACANELPFLNLSSAFKKLTSVEVCVRHIRVISGLKRTFFSFLCVNVVHNITNKTIIVNMLLRIILPAARLCRVCLYYRLVYFSVLVCLTKVNIRRSSIIVWLHVRLVLLHLLITYSSNWV